MCALALAGCDGGLLPGQDPTLPPPTVTATVVPTLTPMPTRTPKPAPSVTPTLAPAAPPPALGGEVLNAENIQAAGQWLVKLPGFASRIFWPGGSRALLQMEGNLHEVALEPLGLGRQIALRDGVLDIAPDAATMLVQRGDGGLYILERSTDMETPVKFPVAYFAIYADDGKTVALGSTDQFQVTILDMATRQTVKTLVGFETAAPVYGAVPGPNGKTLAYFARATLQLQDIASGVMGAKLQYQDFINGFSFSPDGSWLLVGAGGLLQAVEVSAPGRVKAVDLTVPADTYIGSPVFSPDGKLAAAALGSSIGVWETATWTQVATLSLDEKSIRAIAFSPDGKVLAALGDPDVLSIWRIP